ncbi:Sec1-like protein [Gonapodya prolifera JEL478]|uniref:Vacuolar protein sorting-associated protein 45 n=1 Tax=Gonapodya prolifera (strain JEL478) TaxID=1344416 RepID=A0A139A9Y0_GONPJ|nr:Sec1-like protein [Gonapodya prolifera JEL478]|eukprot:KXS13498.1 Sec1-like protein [Gonapodya prolifera JEL478]
MALDVVKAVQNYINKFLADVHGMKVLLLDKDTTPIVSLVLTQSHLLSREVYLVDRIDASSGSSSSSSSASASAASKDPLKHLKCVAFLRPTPESVQALVDELREPRYSEYYLYFSNTLPKSSLERLAESDVQSLVREVHEHFADFYSVNADLFHLGLAPPSSPWGDVPGAWRGDALQRTAQGVCAVMLGLKKRCVVRYERDSAVGKKLAQEIGYLISQDPSLFDFRAPPVPPLLLILDRRSDPVTPLLTQWTYQAMVHELMGITNGRVDMSGVPGVRDEMKEAILSADQDPFYKRNMYLDLGELGANIKTYVDEYQTKHKSSVAIESISDMKRFVEEYPEFRKLAGNVTKHVTIVGELSRLVERGRLLEVGELEQNLAATENHAQDLRTLQQILENPTVSEDNKVRLVILYALRYEKSAGNATQQLLEQLARNKVPNKKIALVNAMLTFAGADSRQSDIFHNDSLLAKSRTLFKGLKGVDNVYTQHQPHLVGVVDELIKGRLKEQMYPFLEGGMRDKPQDIIIFIVGGATYAEARAVTQLNATTPGVRIVLGGTFIHNSRSFLRDVSETVTRWEASGTSSAKFASPKMHTARVNKMS